jgi:hypothetical protein
MKMLRFATIGLVALGLAACSSEEEKPAQNTAATLQASNAKMTAQALTTAVTQIQAGKGQESASTLSGLGMLALGTVAPAGGAAAQAFDGLGHATQADTVGEAKCDDKSCTFKGFGSNSDGGSFTLDGTMSWSEGKVTCDLTFALTSSVYEMDFHETCDFTTTKTSLDGNFKITGSAKSSYQGASGSSNWDVSETFKGITFPEGGGCPTAGTLEASATLTANGQTYTGGGTVTFDGKCY